MTIPGLTQRKNIFIFEGAMMVAYQDPLPSGVSPGDKVVLSIRIWTHKLQQVKRGQGIIVFQLLQRHCSPHMKQKLIHGNLPLFNWRLKCHRLTSTYCGARVGTRTVTTEQLTCSKFLPPHCVICLFVRDPVKKAWSSNDSYISVWMLLWNKSGFILI